MENQINLNFQLLKPFGPTIAEIQVPDNILKVMNSMTENLLIDKNKKSWGEHLVEQIEDELEISKKMLKENGLNGFFAGCLKVYLSNVLQEMYNYDPENYIVASDLTDMWFNEMKPGGEYNPAHFHTNCYVSAVLYLKIPSKRPKRNINHKTDKDGYIEFIDRSVTPENLQKGTMLIEPKEGMMYIWPSSLLHMVYPFLGKETRRSVAWNGTFQLIEKASNKIILGLKQ